MLVRSVNSGNIAFDRRIDYIFVMENHQAKEAVKLSPEAKKKTYVLDVPDIYTRDELELKRILKERLLSYFPHLSNLP